MLDVFQEGTGTKGGGGGMHWIHRINQSQDARDAAKLILTSVIDGKKQRGGKNCARVTFADHGKPRECHRGVKGRQSFLVPDVIP